MQPTKDNGNQVWLEDIKRDYPYEYGPNKFPKAGETKELRPPEANPTHPPHREGYQETVTRVPPKEEPHPFDLDRKTEDVGKASEVPSKKHFENTYEMDTFGPLIGKAKTYDDGKLPLAHLPWAAIDELARVQQYGHGKYTDFNNYRKGMEVSRNLSCALRHIRDFLEGNDKDHESGCNPLSHALCRIAFVLQNIHDHTEIDDRYKPAVGGYGHNT